LLEMNLRTFAALMATAFTLPATLVLVTSTFVTIAVASMFFVMLSVSTSVTVTTAVMTEVTLVMFTVSAHVLHLLSCLIWVWYTALTSAPKRKTIASAYSHASKAKTTPAVL